MDRSLIKKGELVILLLILLASVLTLIVIKNSSGGERVVIEQNGKEIKSFNLAELAEPEIISVQGDNEITAQIKVESDGAAITECNCPDKTCVRTGKISKMNEAIVCLPAKISVVIKGSAADSADAITY